MVGLFALFGLLLAGCQWNDLQPRPAATATAPAQGETPAATAAITLQTEPTVVSPPSVAFERLLAAARGKIAADYPDAVLTSISARPYDYDYTEDYVPAHQILRVTFGFLRPNLDYVSVDMPDDQPTAALHVAMSPVDVDDQEYVDYWREIYSDTLKVRWGLERDLRSAAISPREAISMTRQDALQRAGQIGLEYEVLIPEVTLLPPGEVPTRWEVVYRARVAGDAPFLFGREPLATYTIDLVEARIVSREYTGAVSHDVAEAPTLTMAALTASPTPYTPEPTGTPRPLVTAQDYYDEAEQYRWSEPSRAVKLYSEAIRLDPEMYDAYYERASIYWNEGDYDLAIADYTRMLQGWPDRGADLYYDRGLLYVEKSEEEEGQAAQADLTRAIEDFSRAIELDPSDAQYYFDRGNAYLDKPDNDKALADYNRVLELDPEYFDAYFNRGLVYSRQKEWKKALAEYSKYLVHDPDYVDAYYERGLAFYYSKQGHYAVRDFAQVIRLDGDNSDAYRLRGYSYSMIESYAEAISDFETAIGLNPVDVYAYRGRGFVRMSTGEYDKAIEDFSTVLKLNPEDTLMYDYRGWCYLYMEEYELSIADFDRHIELGADSQSSTIGRAWAYEELGDHDRAIADATSALSSRACPHSAYVVRAVARGAKGQYEQAFADLNLAESGCGKAAIIDYGRGRLYAMQGQTDKAIGELNKAIAGSGKDTFTKKRAETELRKLQDR